MKLKYSYFFTHFNLKTFLWDEYKSLLVINYQLLVVDFTLKLSDTIFVFFTHFAP